MRYLLSALLCLTPWLGFSQSVTRTLNEVSVSASGNDPMSVYRAAPPRVWDIIHQDISLEFDWQRREAKGSVALRLRPYALLPDTLVLDAKGMALHHVQWRGFGPAAYRYDGAQIFLARPARLRFPQDTSIAVVDIVYTAKPYAKAAGGSKAIRGDRGLYFINHDGSIRGQHREIWTQGETESNSHWMPTIDKPNERITFDLWLQNIPDSMVTLSNGALVAKSRGKAPQTQVWHWRMDKPIQPYTVMFAIGNYAVVQDNWRGKPVDYYVEPAYAPYARGIFSNTLKMLDFFSQITGVPYPWNKYSQITARDYVSGAMENTTASLFGEFVNKNARALLDDDNEGVVSHELFHQWFGDYASAESWSNLTLQESFATLGTQLWMEHSRGIVYADAQAWRDLNTYLRAAQRSSPPLVRYHYYEHEDMFDRVSYQKGAVILCYLRSLTGEVLFNKSMKLFLTAHAYQPAEAAHWRQAVEAATGLDWHWFFDQFYYRGGHPVLNIRYQYNDAAQRCTIVVVQRASDDSQYHYHLPLSVVIAYDGVAMRQDTTWLIANATTRITVPYRRGKRPLIIPDPRGMLPGVLREEGKSLAQRADQAVQLNSFHAWELAITAAESELQNPAADRILRAALNGQQPPVLLLALETLQADTAGILAKPLLAQAAKLFSASHDTRVRSMALELWHKWDPRAAAIAVLQATDDSSYRVAATGLQLLAATDQKMALQKARKIVSNRAENVLQDAAFTVLADAGLPQDLERITIALDFRYGRYRSHVGNYLARFALNTTDENAYALALARLERERGAAIEQDERAAYAFQLIELYKALRARSSDRSALQKAILAKRYADAAITKEPDADQRAVLESMLRAGEKRE